MAQKKIDGLEAELDEKKAEPDMLDMIRSLNREIKEKEALQKEVAAQTTRYSELQRELGVLWAKLKEAKETGFSSA